MRCIKPPGVNGCNKFCDYCGTEFDGSAYKSNKRFCSKKCTRSYNNKKRHDAEKEIRKKLYIPRTRDREYYPMSLAEIAKALEKSEGRRFTVQLVEQIFFSAIVKVYKQRHKLKDFEDLLHDNRQKRNRITSYRIG